ncbi:protein translocase subunit SecF [Enterobacteriaceae endosymbiont of Plateumaris consimilis]|uniref:protein translocase subunit SecF n=1 Tax=Enterobacteriaceae endosymbiont of Plateumaris consimilis TaxID=2675794 RepID=UPI0014492697|nr:protein translocase subunit SecF [Enterobacteriaceae endosymbiont of Plateumaris consimilis]QJC28573.1 protein translocase subunit SecF [Enterobacteriaceae endosymbiont of Plateumaris consimilis]
MYFFFNKIKIIKQNKLKYYDFMKWNNYALFVSGILIILSIIIISYKGLNWGVDFTGGTIIELHFQNPISKINNTRLLIQKLYSSKIEINSINNNHNLTLKLSKNQSILKDKQIMDPKLINLIQKLYKQKFVIKKIEYIGPNIGKNLILSGIATIMVTLIGIWIYVGLRFEWHLAYSTIISLLHDLIITLGIISIFYIEIDLSIISSLMSIICYSLNDSIVISDRIRENCYKLNNYNIYKIINLSINQTFKRSIITSLTVLTMISILYVFGGIVLNNFSLIMFIGVIFGTISSIYVVSSLALKMGMNVNNMINNK